MLVGLSPDAVVQVLRQRLKLTDYPREDDVWDLLEVMKAEKELKIRWCRTPLPYVTADRKGVPVVSLARGIPRSQQTRPVFEEISHILLCGPGLAVMPPLELVNGHRHFLKIEDRDEAEADALWLAWLLPRELVLRDFDESIILEASGCSPEELQARLAMLAR